MEDEKETAQCRLCLDEFNEIEMHDLFKDVVVLSQTNAEDATDLEGHEFLKLSEQVEYCFGVRIRESSELPSKICLKCHEMTQNWFNFRQMVINSEIYLNNVAVESETLIGDLSKGDDYWLIVAEDLQSFRAHARKSNAAFVMNVESLREGIDNCLEDELKGELDDYTEAAIQMEIERLEAPQQDDDDDEDSDFVPYPTVTRKKRPFSGGQSKTKGSELKQRLRNIKGDIDDDDDDDTACLPSSGENEESNGAADSARRKLPPQKMLRKHLPCQQNRVPNENELYRMLAKRPYRPESPTSYMCSECGNLYHTRSSFKYHMAIHTNHKPHECELCGKKFRLVIELNSHMRRHTGEKPFKCRYCTRCFVDSSERIRHERVHTNTRPYSCNFCDKSFTYSSTLKNHILIHSGIKEYHCAACEKSFSLKKNYAAHLLTATHKQKECVSLS